MFEERMTTFEYEFLNTLWRVTGVALDRYELLLDVDVDITNICETTTLRTQYRLHNFTSDLLYFVDLDALLTFSCSDIGFTALSKLTILEYFESGFGGHFPALDGRNYATISRGTLDLSLFELKPIRLISECGATFWD
ncbi:hypothetical protein B0H10DRAFT_2217662 [Mycena sp. CBHHK59/15]|nr:hypothetical protein B0H10DRAFT_2217662 [Mycena sp. CBHHK59/15]